MVFLLSYHQAKGQGMPWHHSEDSLRGFLYPWRSAVTMQRLDVSIEPNLKDSSLKGCATIDFTLANQEPYLQWELAANYSIDSVFLNGLPAQIAYRKGAHFFLVAKELTIGKHTLRVNYSGKPVIAPKPPWEGGIVWQRIKNGNWFIGSTVEGEGALHWFPCKDHLTEKPQKVRVSATLDKKDSLQLVCGGIFLGRVERGTKVTDAWQYNYAVPLYSIAFNISKYKHLSDSLLQSNGRYLKTDFYVFPESIAKLQSSKFMEQAKRMLSTYDEILGPYPFFEDGYGLVETPYWGMEHQGGIAYGNNFKNNDFGFDFILVHESAHEYWGNAVSCDDHGAMYIQEGFCTYMESLLLEKWYGRKRAEQYLQMQKKYIINKAPVLSVLGVNYTANDTDIYYKYALALHTLRTLVDDDKQFFSFLKYLYNKYKYKTLSHKELQIEYRLFFGKSVERLMNFYATALGNPVISCKVSDRGTFLKGDAYLEGFYLINRLQKKSKRFTFGREFKQTFVPQDFLKEWASPLLLDFDFIY